MRVEKLARACPCPRARASGLSGAGRFDRFASARCTTLIVSIVGMLRLVRASTVVVNAPSGTVRRAPSTRGPGARRECQAEQAGGCKPVSDVFDSTPSNRKHRPGGAGRRVL